MSDRPTPSRRQVLVAGLTTGATTWAVTGQAHASTTTPRATATPTTDDLPLRVSVLQVTPTAYAADDPARSVITVRARIRNGTSAAQTGLTARLVVQRSATAAREALAGWASSSTTRSTGRNTVASDQVPVGTDGELAAGASTEVTLVLPAEQLGTAVGAHLTSVEVRDSSQRRGIARTFLVPVAAEGSAAPTLLTLMLPFVAGRVEPTALTDDPAAAVVPSIAQLADLVDGRLGRLLAAGADPRTAWALDPALLLAAAAARSAPAGSALETATPEPPTGAATEEQTTAVAGWLAGLRTAVGGRSVVVLPFGDPDLASLTRSTAGTRLLDAARSAGAGATDSLDADLLTNLAWPADEQVDDETLAAAAAAGTRTLVLADDCLVPDDELTFTPSGRAALSSGGTTVQAVVADRTMSQQLGSLAVEPADGATDAAAVQRLLAEIATVTLQRPNDARSLLLTTARSFDPDPGALDTLRGAVEASGWGRWQSLSDLLAVPVPDVDRTGPELSEETRDAELPTAHLASVSAALTDVDAFATALSTQDAGSDTSVLARRRAALLLLGASWRGHTDLLPGARRELAASLEGLSAGIRILGGSVRNLAATRSELPITLVNELDVPVQVDLVLKPRTPRVQLDTVPRQTIPARSQQRVAVPVRALANGSVVIDASLLTPAETPVGTSVEVDLNVRMDVETWLTAIVGGGAGALLVAGVWRAVRRGRRRVDEVEHADVGDPPDGRDSSDDPSAPDESAAAGKST